MTWQNIDTSPQRYARLCGAFYLAVIVLGAFSEGYVSAKLIVPGDASASATNILASPSLWNVGAAADLLVVMLAVPQLWLEYYLLRPVNRQLALLAVMFNLVSLAVEAVSKLFLLTVKPILGNHDATTAFSPKQLHQLADLALQFHHAAFNVALLFFAFTCLLYGYLIYRSGYLPRFVGVLMQLAGLSYLVACTAALFWPALLSSISPLIYLPILIGELSFCLWLLIQGVSVKTWHARGGSVMQSAHSM